MSPVVKLRRVEDVSDNSRICHYDELEEAAKEQFPALADAETQTTVDPSTAVGFGECELVKYTDYYEVSLS